MPFTLGQASIQTGKSKPTILKALKSGRMSGEKVGNEWQIDPAELFRVYPKATAVNPTETPPAFHSVNPTATPSATPLTETSIDLLTLRLKLEAAEQQIEALKDDRDQWRQVANRLLSSPPQAAPAAPARGPSGFFGRFFRGS